MRKLKYSVTIKDMGIVNATLKITNPLDISKVFEGEFLIVLGGSRDDYLLGVVTLENLGFSINPFTRELYPTKLIM